MNNIDNLNIFMAWASAFAQSNEGKCLGATVTSSELSENPSARIDVCSAYALGRITSWSDGSYYAEALDVKTEEQIFEKLGTTEGKDSLSEVFAPFFDAMQGNQI